MTKRFILFIARERPSFGDVLFTIGATFGFAVLIGWLIGLATGLPAMVSAFLALLLLASFFAFIAIGEHFWGKLLRYADSVKKKEVGNG